MFRAPGKSEKFNINLISLSILIIYISLKYYGIIQIIDNNI